MVVTDVPVEVMKSVEVMTSTQLPDAQLVEPSVDLPIELAAAAPLEQQVAQSVAPPITPPESATQHVSAQSPSLWAWLKQQLLGATKK
jgi:hypothetical protein